MKRALAVVSRQPAGYRSESPARRDVADLIGKVIIGTLFDAAGIENAERSVGGDRAQVGRQEKFAECAAAAIEARHDEAGGIAAGACAELRGGFQHNGLDAAPRQRLGAGRAGDTGTDDGDAFRVCDGGIGVEWSAGLQTRIVFLVRGPRV